MRKVAIITLAGTSSRFSKSVGRECHKSLFRETPDSGNLLEWQIGMLEENGFEKIILVGGYRYDELVEQVKSRFAALDIVLVKNDHYQDWGSCYSLCLGIEALPDDAHQVVFLEGDLLFDKKTFASLVASPVDAITSTHTIVDARTSVAFYISAEGRLRYVYDTKHKCLTIEEPFVRIGNSGQVWQFSDATRLKASVAKLGEAEWRGTNLIPILDYYNGIDGNRIPVYSFEAWFNCNTIADYRAMRQYVKEA